MKNRVVWPGPNYSCVMTAVYRVNTIQGRRDRGEQEGPWPLKFCRNRWIFGNFNVSFENCRTFAVAKDKGFGFCRKVFELAPLCYRCHNAPDTIWAKGRPVLLIHFFKANLFGYCEGLSLISSCDCAYLGYQKCRSWSNRLSDSSI